MASNFDKNDKHVADYQGTPYDLRSIMQYGKTAFKKPSVPGKRRENNEKCLTNSYVRT